MPDDVVLIEVDGPVALVTLNRPANGNAADAVLHSRLADLWSELAAVPGLRAVVLTGAGTAFSAGGDLGLLQGMVDSGSLRRRIMDEAREIVHALVTFPLPVVAAVNGPAVGLGCSLAGLSDLVVMDERAFLADPHVSIGLVAGDGAALTWPRHMGLQRSKEWILLGGRISAQEAVRLGIANRIADAGRSVEIALEIARRLAALPPQAVRETLAALDAPLLAAVNDGELDRVLAAETRSFDEPAFHEALSRARGGDR